MMTGLSGFLIVWFGGAILMALCPFFNRDEQ